MVTSLAVLTIRKEKCKQVFEILDKFVAEEKAKSGVLRTYYKHAVDNDDTLLLCTEYEDRKAFEASDKETLKEGHARFVLRPYLLKAFYGNFE